MATWALCSLGTSITLHVEPCPRPCMHTSLRKVHFCVFSVTPDLGNDDIKYDTGAVLKLSDPALWSDGCRLNAASASRAPRAGSSHLSKPFSFFSSFLHSPSLSLSPCLSTEWGWGLLLSPRGAQPLQVSKLSKRVTLPGLSATPSPHI